MKKLLGNVGEIHTAKVNPHFRRIATPPPEPYSLIDEFDLLEDQLLFSTTSGFNDRDAGMFDSILKMKFFFFISFIVIVSYVFFFFFIIFLLLRQFIHR